MTSQTGIRRFEPYELDAGAGELRKAGRKLKIQPQPLKVLAYLANRPGELVTREELREAIWGTETFVDFEQGLNYCIRQIRAVLREDTEKPKYIETLPKRGYRFIAAVAMDPEAAAIPEPSSADRVSPWSWWQIGTGIAALALLAILVLLIRGRTSPAKPAETTIAVLPFANLSTQKDQDYFARGLTEEVISRLSVVGGLRVLGRASAFALPAELNIRAAADRLRVRNVLTGSVRPQGERVRITVQLVDAQEDLTLWSQTYDRKLADVLVVQEEIAHSVAGTLKEKFGIEASGQRKLKRPSNPEAYNQYLRALYVGRKITPAALDQAIGILDQVIRMEPDFAAAHAYLARCYLRKEVFGFPTAGDSLTKPEAAARRALALDPQSAEAQSALGDIYMLRFQFAEAIDRLQQAIRLDPNLAFPHEILAVVHIIQGDVEASLRESARAIEVDPLSLIANRDRGMVQFLARRYDDALLTFRQIQELEPDFPWAYYTATRVHIQKGNCLEAMQSANRHSSLVGLATTVLPLAIATCDGPEAGRKALVKYMKDKHSPGPAASIAAVYAAIGDRERALEELENAGKQPREGMLLLRVNPEFDSIRDEPRFQAVMRKLGLIAQHE